LTGLKGAEVAGLGAAKTERCVEFGRARLSFLASWFGSCRLGRVGLTNVETCGRREYKGGKQAGRK